MTGSKKTAIVTGSTSGIGYGIAEAFAAADIDIVLNGFGNVAEIEALRAGLESKHKVKVTYSSADMTKPDEIRKMVTDAAAVHGSVDILVNNAGIQFTAPVVDFPDERWDQIIAINLSAAFHASKAALPIMKKNGWGRVINIASAHGLVGSPFKAAYVAAKHGLVGLTKVIAIEHANDGITANAICPGWVLTPLVQKQLVDRARQNGTTVDQEKLALVAEKQPMHSFVSTDQLGGLALFLVSAAAASITGASLSIDGGWTAE
jgi:3-hydroxybutyrate dehydrogenase